VVALYVVGVFLVFTALAHFVFHSPEAVQALLLTCIASLAPLSPGILTRVEYRLTEEGLGKRTVSKKEGEGFQEVVRWDDVSRLVPTSSGFKFYKKVEEPQPLKRFYKRHLSGEASGEIQVEKDDRERVRAFLSARLPELQRGIR
jgi:hypothetical protein